MRQILRISAVVALAIGLSAYGGAGGQQKGGGADRVQPIEQQQAQDRVRTETQEQVRIRDEDIYGHELMTGQELNRYREQMQMMGTAKAREQFQVQHEEKMRERARQQNKDIVPPGQGPIYRGELMSVEERNEFREQLRVIESEEERARFLARHREKMDQRAESAHEETEEAE
jgi:hypothetical protein